MKYPKFLFLGKIMSNQQYLRNQLKNFFVSQLRLNKKILKKNCKGFHNNKNQIIELLKLDIKNSKNLHILPN